MFIEELVEALFDEGVLVRNGPVKVTRPLSQLKIPPTVQGILAARLKKEMAMLQMLTGKRSACGACIWISGAFSRRSIIARQLSETPEILSPKSPDYELSSL